MGGNMSKPLKIGWHDFLYVPCPVNSRSIMKEENNIVNLAVNNRRIIITIDSL
jgi:hypothetical protein